MKCLLAHLQRWFRRSLIVVEIVVDAQHPSPTASPSELSSTIAASEKSSDIPTGSPVERCLDEFGRNYDSTTDALAHLHHACSGFGAAPTQPDWLDDTCSSREGVYTADAGGKVAKAWDCLTKLGALANAQHSNSIKKCIAVLAGQERQASYTTAILSCMTIGTANDIICRITMPKKRLNFKRQSHSS